MKTEPQLGPGTSPDLERRTLLEMASMIAFINDAQQLMSKVEITDVLRNIMSGIRNQWTKEGRDFNAFLDDVQVEVAIWQTDHRRRNK